MPRARPGSRRARHLAVGDAPTPAGEEKGGLSVAAGKTAQPQATAGHGAPVASQKHATSGRRSDRGPIEQSLIGTPIADVRDPVEVGHVCRSYDSCLVCTVHAHDARSGEELARFRTA